MLPSLRVHGSGVIEQQKVGVDFGLGFLMDFEGDGIINGAVVAEEEEEQRKGDLRASIWTGLLLFRLVKAHATKRRMVDSATITKECGHWRRKAMKKERR